MGLGRDHENQPATRRHLKCVSATQCRPTLTDVLQRAAQRRCELESRDKKGAPSEQPDVVSLLALQSYQSSN
jgi:hypothetical protein